MSAQKDAGDAWGLEACAAAWRRTAVLVSAALGSARGRDAADARRRAVLAAARAQAICDDAQWGPAAVARCQAAQEADARALLALLQSIAAASAAPAAVPVSGPEPAEAEPERESAPKMAQTAVEVRDGDTVLWLEASGESSGSESAGEDPDYIDVAGEYE